SLGRSEGPQQWPCWDHPTHVGAYGPDTATVGPTTTTGEPVSDPLAGPIWRRPDQCSNVSPRQPEREKRTPSGGPCGTAPSRPVPGLTALAEEHLVDVRAHRHGRFGAEQLDCYGWHTTGKPRSGSRERPCAAAALDHPSYRW